MTGYNQSPGSPLRSVRLTVTQVFSVQGDCNGGKWLSYVQVDELWLYTASVTDGIVTDACKGDSGGPLIIEKGGQHLLIGVLEVINRES